MIAVFMSIHELYEGYNGANINEVDAVMVVYPFGYYLDAKSEFFIANDTMNEILYNDLVYYSEHVGGSNGRFKLFHFVVKIKQHFI